jgi:RNA polymerase sigma factor FliA
MIDHNGAEALVHKYQDYMRSLARKIFKSLPPQVDFDELVGFAQVGLVEAARAFRIDLGASFQTFSYYRIRGAIFDGLRKMTWLPPAARSDVARQSGIDEVALSQSDRPVSPTDPESITQRFRDSLRLLGVVHLVSQADDDRANLDAASREVDPTDHAEQREATLLVRQVLERLPGDQRSLIRSHYFEGSSLTDCATAMNMHKATASRLHAKAIASIRTQLEHSN